MTLWIKAHIISFDEEIVIQMTKYWEVLEL
jgi:hypothetical protein